jgi:hypothetical protein
MQQEHALALKWRRHLHCVRPLLRQLHHKLEANLRHYANQRPQIQLLIALIPRKPPLVRRRSRLACQRTHRRCLPRKQQGSHEHQGWLHTALWHVNGAFVDLKHCRCCLVHKSGC